MRLGGPRRDRGDEPEGGTSRLDLADLAPTPARDDDARRSDPLASLRQRTHEALFERVGTRLFDASLSEQQVQAYVLQEISQLMDAEAAPLSPVERQRLASEISDDVLGHGPIE